MRTELLRIVKNPLYWLIIGSGLAARTVTAYLDSLYRSSRFWALALEFWDKTGSVTIGFLILLVLIRCFSYDVETGVFPVVNSTAYGRLPLLLARLAGGALAIVLSVALLYGGNIGISFLLGNRIDAPDGWAGSFGAGSTIALAGAEGFYILSALVCDLAKNQPIAMSLCGPAFACGYFINSAAVKPPDVFWFLKYGFFYGACTGKSHPILSSVLAWLVFAVHRNGVHFCDPKAEGEP